jgi:pseudaminic acid synthase
MRISYHEIGKEIGPDAPPFIIAEMSGNHNQSLERALAIVKAAKEAGVHAVKLQTYTPDTITIQSERKEFRINDPKSLWHGETLYSLYQKAYTPWEWHKPIFDLCNELGLICFSTPFDPTAVDFLEELDVPCYKIASFELVDLPLIKKIATTEKPIIMSTGMATIAEIDEAVSAAREKGCNDIILLKCTSTYPASPKASNLNTIPHMRNLFGCEIGLSDHTPGIGVSITAVALGAAVIEKHFTLDRKDGGVDAAFSLEPDEMKTLVEESLRAWESLGVIKYGPTNEESPSLKFRRSLYIVKDMKKGDVFTDENLRSIRPGHGLPPKYLDIFLGRPAAKDAAKGVPLSWDYLAG